MRAIILATVASLLLASSTGLSADSAVQEAIITTGVTPSAEPATVNLSVVDHRVGDVTFFTKIIGMSGQVVTHRWYYLGSEVSTITLQIGSGNSINWSRSTIAPSQTGRWEARVVDQGGRVLASREFDVVESSKSVAQVVRRRQVDSCSVKLGQLKVKMEQNPTVDYYKFLFDKQSERCNTN